MAILSRFAQKLIKDGYVARYNSIKNVPVFYKEEFDEQVTGYLNNNVAVSSEDVQAIIVELEKAKVIVPSEEYDEIV